MLDCLALSSRGLSASAFGAWRRTTSSRAAATLSGAWDVATPAIASGSAWHGILPVQSLAVPPSRLPGLVSGLPPPAARLQPHFIDLVALGLRWSLIKTTLRLMVSCRRLTPACLLLFWSPCGLSLQLRRRRSALSYRPCSLLVLRCCSSLFKTWLLLWRVGLLKSQAYGNLWKLSGAAKTLPMLNLLLLLWPLVRIAVRLLWLAAQLS